MGQIWTWDKLAHGTNWDIGQIGIWDKLGHIVTNFHVINKVDDAKITLTLKNGDNSEILFVFFVSAYDN